MIAAATGGGYPRPQYQTAQSIESALVPDSSDILDGDAVEAEGNRFRRRRRATIIAIAAIFVTAGTILIVSVVHDLQNRPEVGFFDEICSTSDAECIENKCPIGYKWKSDLNYCEQIEGTSFSGFIFQGLYMYFGVTLHH